MGLISDLDWSRILYRCTTAILLGIASVLSLPAVVLMHSDLNLDELTSIEGNLVGIVGALGAAGFISLLVCMGFFWLKCDLTSKANRTVWFFILLLGFAFGSHIAYFAIVYVPAVMRRLQNEGDVQIDERTQDAEPSRRRIGPFSRILLAGWAILALAMAVVWLIPRSGPGFVATVAFSFFLYSIAVAVESVIYRIASLFREGTKRPARSDREHPLGPKS